MLVALPAETAHTHFAISASRSVGSAVRRNRAKRLMRAAVRPWLDEVLPGWDVILIARNPLAEASFAEVQAVLPILLRRAHLLKESHGG